MDEVNTTETSEPHIPEVSSDVASQISSATYSFVRKANSYLSINHLLPDSNKSETEGQDMSNDCVLSELENCIVNLVRTDIQISALQVNELKNCFVITGPISGSVLLRKCVGCVFLLACHQVSDHECR